MASSPLDVECIHPFCLAQKQQACGEFDITTGGRTPFLIDGKPAYHAERIASLSMNAGGNVSREEFAEALERTFAL